jgi:hypothetical protein
MAHQLAQDSFETGQWQAGVGDRTRLKSTLPNCDVSSQTASTLTQLLFIYPCVLTFSQLTLAQLAEHETVVVKFLNPSILGSLVRFRQVRLARALRW